MDWLELAVLVIAATCLGFFTVYYCVSIYQGLSNKASSTRGSFKYIALPLVQALQAYIPRPEQVVFYELKSGRGNVSRFVSRFIQFQRIVGIEKNPILALGSALENALYRSRVTISKGDIHFYNYNPGSVLYCCLNTDTVNQIYKKGVLGGQLVISIASPIKKIQPTAQVPLPGIDSDMYVYDFRS